MAVNLGVLRLYFDGSSRNNGRPDCTASYGWRVVRVEWVSENGPGRSDVFGEFPLASGRGAPVSEVMSNNVAELAGLEAGLKWVAALECGLVKVEVRGDSRLAIGLATGRMKTKKPWLMVYQERVRHLLKSVACPTDVAWIPREKNAEADRLSKPVDREPKRK